MSESIGSGLGKAAKAQSLRFNGRKEFQKGAFLVSAALLSVCLLLGGILVACWSLDGVSSSVEGTPGITWMGGNTIPPVAPVPDSAQQGSKPHTTGSLFGDAGDASGDAQASEEDLIFGVLEIDDASGFLSATTGTPGWPRLVPSEITIAGGKWVTLLLPNNDADAPVPLITLSNFVGSSGRP